jgi:hypothetical protein
MSGVTHRSPYDSSPERIHAQPRAAARKVSRGTGRSKHLEGTLQVQMIGQQIPRPKDTALALALASGPRHNKLEHW